MIKPNEIVIRGARTHNLRGVDVEIPRGALTVITGVSGSGKSSLAFDTLYAEGQRRYVESMSTYARQFLERMTRPEVDFISGIPPALAIEQRGGGRSARSTVGTATEISDYLRLLFATVGEVRCHRCGGSVARDTASQVAQRLLEEASGRRALVIAEVDGPATPNWCERMMRAGYHRLYLNEKIEYLPEIEPARLVALGSLPLVVDRLALAEEDRARLAASLEAAFSLSAGQVKIHVEGEAAPRRYDEAYRCASCGCELRAPTPALFSHNSPLGACPACQGFGRTVGIDWDKVIPDGSKSIAEGAIAPFQTPSGKECQDDLVRGCRREGVRLDVPWQRLRESERRFVIEGGGIKAWSERKWYGISGFFHWLETKKYKMYVRVLLARYRGYEPCLDCQGTRLRPEARAVFLGGKSITDLEAMSVGALRAFGRNLASSMAKASPKKGELQTVLGRQARTAAAPLLEQIDARLGYLEDVGLEYLSLIRATRTLSGGEAQRIALAAALGAQLTGTLYVLDEPSVGLHARDTDRLLKVLRALADRGNTVVVVEHDPEVIRAADHVIDLGPGAGRYGGEVVFAGSFAALGKSHTSLTADLYRKRRAPLVENKLKIQGFIEVEGARAHNLKNLTVRFPLGQLVCVTGVSGSGKSSLVEDVLYANLLRARGRSVDAVGACDALHGAEAIEDVVLVDQSPLPRSSRSNPATYLKAFEEIRQLLARTPDARRLGLGPGAFSFNVARKNGGGRCEVCAGQGTVTLEMHFLADVTVSCEACQGKRFEERILNVRLDGRNINEILALTVAEALRVFAGFPRITSRLQPFADVGLGYLQLGQATATLSGGEAQRLKLAAHLAEPAKKSAQRKGTLFMLDEPTSGLHAADVEVLLQALKRLRDAGHSIIVVEHNLDFIRQADYIIDLGPEGGEEGGGNLVATGSPATIRDTPSSYTGQALRLLEERAKKERGRERK